MKNEIKVSHAVIALLRATADEMAEQYARKGVLIEDCQQNLLVHGFRLGLAYADSAHQTWVEEHAEELSCCRLSAIAPTLSALMRGPDDTGSQEEAEPAPARPQTTVPTKTGMGKALRDKVRQANAKGRLKEIAPSLSALMTMGSALLDKVRQANEKDQTWESELEELEQLLSRSSAFSDRLRSILGQ